MILSIFKEEDTQWLPTSQASSLSLLVHSFFLAHEASGLPLFLSPTRSLQATLSSQGSQRVAMRPGLPPALVLVHRLTLQLRPHLQEEPPLVQPPPPPSRSLFYSSIPPFSPSTPAIIYLLSIYSCVLIFHFGAILENVAQD